jgi:predicted PurR-regulated permease PerM
VSKAGVVIILVTVIGLHLLAMNVLYPRIVGRRLRLNPAGGDSIITFLGVDLGSDGPDIAVPLVGATKVICDYVDSLRGLGARLGD